MDGYFSCRRSDTTARTTLQISAVQHGYNLDSLSRDVIISMKSDTAGYSHSTYRGVLAAMSDKTADYMRVHDYFAQKLGDSAMALFNTLATSYAIDTLHDSTYITHKAYIQFQKELLDDSLAIGNLDSTHISTLNSIALSGIGPAARQAKGILHFFYGYPYRTQLEVNLPTGGDRMMHVSAPRDSVSTTDTSFANNFLRVYPNPTSGVETFEFNLPGNNAEGLLVVADMTGDTKYSLLFNGALNMVEVDTKAWENGVYLYRLTHQDKVVGSGKFEVVR